MAAARAGYQVAAFDVFNDVDTRRHCFYSARVKFSGGGFDAADLLDSLSACDLSGALVLYGSGLEGQSEVLAQIAGRYRLLGNPVEIVAEVKTPQRFIPLLDQLNIDHPETVFDAPADTVGWLSKSAGGSGGTHIRRGSGGAGCYYQREVEGVPVSVLFLADGKNVEIVGYNEQWSASTSTMPFRYGGAVGNADLPIDAKASMAEAARKITSVVGLRGLNSMDFMLGAQAVSALEINPRLSASFELYDIPDLLDRHLLACRGVLPPLPGRDWGAKAGVICYAPRDIVVSAEMAWPDWAVDLPPVGSHIGTGEPVCSVIAHAESAARAKELAFARARQLDAQYDTL